MPFRCCAASLAVLVHPLVWLAGLSFSSTMRDLPSTSVLEKCRIAFRGAFSFNSTPSTAQADPLWLGGRLRGVLLEYVWLPNV